MHSLYATTHQPYHDAHYSIFLAEVASTVNEVLLTWKLLDETPASDVGARFSILNRFADTIYTTLIRQTMFAEFEMKTHAHVEAGEPLTLASLNDYYGDVVAAYTPGVNLDERAKYGWSRVPHFYRAFYVFQYATGLSWGVAIARAIRDEGAPAAARYQAMLQAGGSDYPMTTLQRAGVDLTTPEPVREALAEFDAVVAEMERLHAAGGV
jgi:oligoendopeptidase F